MSWHHSFIITSSLNRMDLTPSTMHNKHHFNSHFTVPFNFLPQLVTKVNSIGITGACTLYALCPLARHLTTVTKDYMELEKLMQTGITMNIMLSWFIN